MNLTDIYIKEIYSEIVDGDWVIADMLVVDDSLMPRRVTRQFPATSWESGKGWDDIKAKMMYLG